MTKLKQIKKADYQNFIKQFEALITEEFNAVPKVCPYTVNFKEWEMETVFGKLNLTIHDIDGASSFYGVYSRFQDYSEALYKRLGVSQNCKWNHHIFDTEMHVDLVIDEIERRFECLKIK